MAATCHLEFCPSWIQPFCTLKLWLKLNSHLEFSDSAILHKNKTHSFSHSTWWCQPSWILPSWIQTLIQPSWIQILTLLSSRRFTWRNTLTPLSTLTQTNSIWLAAILNSAMLDSVAILNLAILDTAILVFPLNSLTHTWLKIGLLLICTKKKLTHSFILTQLDHDRFNILNSAMIDSDTAILEFRHLVIFSQIHLLSITLLLHSDDGLWLKLIQSDSNSFIQPYLTWMMSAILNSAILDSDTGILDSDTLLSSRRFT